MAETRTPETEEEWVSLSEAARRTGYTKGTLSVLAKEGKIPSKRGFVKVTKIVKIVEVDMPAVLVHLPSVYKRKETVKPGPAPKRKD